jgi:phage shock protein E
MMNAIKEFFGLGPAVNYKELLNRGAVIIDVRTIEEFRQGHIDRSVNIPLNSLPHNLSKLKKDQVIITCCASGIRSASAKSILNSNGYSEVYNGGGWKSLQNKLE